MKETPQEKAAWKAWQHEQMIACGGDRETYNAWQFLFYGWEWTYSLDDENRDEMLERLFTPMLKGDAKFFRNVVKYLECRSVRYPQDAILVSLHRPMPGGERPKFTHEELITEFAKRRRDISGRRLRTLMQKYRYRFRNSRKP